MLRDIVNNLDQIFLKQKSIQSSIQESAQYCLKSRPFVSIYNNNSNNFFVVFTKKNRWQYFLLKSEQKTNVLALYNFSLSKSLNDDFLHFSIFLRLFNTLQNRWYSSFKINTMSVIKVGIAIIKQLHFVNLIILMHNQFQNQKKKNLMSIPPKFPASNFPIRNPYTFPGLNLEKMGNNQQVHQKNNNILPMIPGANQQGLGNLPIHPYFAQRMFNPFLNSYGMMPMPQYTPYSPFGRQQMNQNIGTKEKALQNPPELEIKKIPNSSHVKKSPEVIEVDALQNSIVIKKSQSEANRQKYKQKQAQIKPKKLEAYRTGFRLQKQQKKNSPRKHSGEQTNPRYMPYGTPKKKQKIQQQIVEPMIQRKTREKKPGIERMFIRLMKDKPQRDMMMKIGKEHQAVIPESYLNQYQYALKIKMEKKKSLLARMNKVSQQTDQTVRLIQPACV